MKDINSSPSNSKSEDTHTKISKAIDELSWIVDESPQALKASNLLRELLPKDWYTFEPPQDTSLDDTNKALERAFKDYRIGCDMALSERDDGVYTQAEYEEAIMWELDNAISFVHEIYSSLLKQQQTKLIERINDEVIGEDEALVKADPMQKRSLEIRRNELRAEQREAINKLKESLDG